jgi:hypothetical protein
LRFCRPCFGCGGSFGSSGIVSRRGDVLVRWFDLRQVTADPVGDLCLRMVVRRFRVLSSGGSVLFQPDEIVAEGLVHGDDTASGGALCCQILVTKCVVDIGNDHFVKHQKMTGEYGLNGITWPERHDRTDGGPRAVVLALPGFARALADSLGGIAGDRRNKVLEAEGWLRVHEWGALRSVCGSLLIYLTKPRRQAVLDPISDFRLGLSLWLRRQGCATNASRSNAMATTPGA